MKRRGVIRVGTSGWNYRHWCGPFYPKDASPYDWFHHYAGVFDTVEINNTFYQLPETTTFDRWKKQAPQGFVYAVKASRYLTHMKKLKDAKEPLEHFLKRARRLESHLGPVLYQLPPRWRPDWKRLDAFCAALPKDNLHVLEFRERDWLQEKTYDILRTHGVCLCVHDLLKRHPRRITGPAVYVRFHGAGAKYGGSYSRRRLRAWADWMRDAAEDGHDVYAYFNNDARACAVRNARVLRTILGLE